MPVKPAFGRYVNAPVEASTLTLPPWALVASNAVTVTESPRSGSLAWLRIPSEEFTSFGSLDGDATGPTSNSVFPTAPPVTV